MAIVRITLTQFTAKPSNRPAYTELAYGKTHGTILKTKHQPASIHGFFFHFTENSENN